VLYLATSPGEPAVNDLLNRRRIGLMCQPGNGNGPRVGWWWAADNGCFAAQWEASTWRRWLQRDFPRAGCLFATVPDVVADHAATLDRFYEYVPCVRAARYPIALVAQDGLTVEATPWDQIDVLFIGGSTAFKMSPDAFMLASTARQHGKWVHVGRVNSWSRYQAWAWTADSCDGTLLAFGPAINLPRIAAWVDRLDRQPQLTPVCGR
jgi:hypothetical protein